VCRHPQADQISRALLAGRSFRDIAKRWPDTSTHRKLSITALSRHRRDHISPALAVVRAQREKASEATIADQVRQLVEEAAAVGTSARESGNAALQLAAIREKRSSLELVARLIGELNPEPQKLTINVLAAPEFQDAMAVVLDELSGHPALRQAVAARLRALPSVEGR
jgi:hypothetical protein